MIRWQDLDPARIERAVQMLVRRLYPVVSIDGSGGDDGQDMRWDRPSGLVIFEVKSFSKRLTQSQKRQIKRSLARAAAEHRLAKWILIMPLNQTPAEVVWSAEVLQPLAPDVELEWWGRDWLDGEFASREDLVAYVEGTDYQLLSRAKEMNQEQSILAGGSTDLSSRLTRIGQRVDDISPHWRWDFERSGNVVTLTLAEKYLGAAAVDPVTVRPHLLFPSDDPEAQEVVRALRQALDFGGQVVVPRRFVERVEVIAASDETRRLIGADAGYQKDSDLQIASIADSTGLPMTLRLELTSQSAIVRHQVDVTLSHRVAGQRGVTVCGRDPSGVLLARLLLTSSTEDRVTSRLELEYQPTAGLLPHAVIPALELLQDAEPGDTIVLRNGPVVLGSTVPLTEAQSASELGVLIEFAKGLVRLESHCGTLLPIPHSDIDPLQARAVIDAAGVLNGRKMRLPGRGMTVTVRGERISDFLATMQQDEGALYAVHPLTVMVGDNEVSIETVATYAPRMRLTNRAELQRAVGAGQDIDAEFECIDGEGMYWTPPMGQDERTA